MDYWEKNFHAPDSFIGLAVAKVLTKIFRME